MPIAKPYIPFSQRLVRGAIGKRYVIKHYTYGVVRTRYPAMAHIRASEKQAACRQHFTKINAAVRAIYNDPVVRLAWQVRLGNPPRLYSAIFKAYNKALAAAALQRQPAAGRIIRHCFAALPAVKTTRAGKALLQPVVGMGQVVYLHKIRCIPLCDSG